MRKLEENAFEEWPAGMDMERDGFKRVMRGELQRCRREWEVVFKYWSSWYSDNHKPVLNLVYCAGESESIYYKTQNYCSNISKV